MKSEKERPHAKPQSREGSAKFFSAIVSAVLRLCVKSFCVMVAVNTIVNFEEFSFAADKPNFTGAWVFDKDKGYGYPSGLEQTMTITHNGDEIKLEVKQKSVYGEFNLSESYALDAKETEFTPQQQSPGAKGKRKAYWLPNNKGILIEDAITTDSPNGPTTQLITRKWLLSPDGQTLTVDYYFDGPRGAFESKRVFVKKKN